MEAAAPREVARPPPTSSTSTLGCQPLTSEHKPSPRQRGRRQPHVRRIRFLCRASPRPCLPTTACPLLVLLPVRYDDAAPHSLLTDDAAPPLSLFSSHSVQPHLHHRHVPRCKRRCANFIDIVRLQVVYGKCLWKCQGQRLLLE